MCRKIVDTPRSFYRVFILDLNLSIWSGPIRYPEFNLGYLCYEKDPSIREYIMGMLLDQNNWDESTRIDYWLWKQRSVRLLWSLEQILLLRRKQLIIGQVATLSLENVGLYGRYNRRLDQRLVVLGERLRGHLWRPHYVVELEFAQLG